MIASRAQEIYSAEFDRIFFKLPQQVRERLEAKIAELGTKLNSFPHHRLKGSSDCRLRVGDYRVIYSFDLQENVLYLVTLGNRREIYRNL
jgi:mRNA interferase RelE/StbE